jgi:sRNA-binding protein
LDDILKKELLKIGKHDSENGLKDFLKKRNRTLMWLCKNYPKCFSIERPVPLKIGIIRDIYEIIPAAISRTIVRKVLQRYTRTKRYLDALISNPYRYNLEGERAGDVSNKEKETAQAIIDTFKIQDRVGVCNVPE